MTAPIPQSKIQNPKSAFCILVLLSTVLATVTPAGGPLPPMAAPPPVPADPVAALIAPVTAENLTPLLVQVAAYRTRNTYSQTGVTAREALLSALRASNLTVEDRLFFHGAVEVHNLVATLPGTDAAAGEVLLTAHYDTINGSASWSDPEAPAPGANDDGTGVSSLLLFSRLLPRYRFASTVRLVLFGAEEQGRWGSAQYASEAAGRGEVIRGVINLDMFGYNWRYPKVDAVARPEYENLTGAVVSAAAGYEPGLLVRKVYTNLTPDRWSDHLSFWERSIPAVHIVEDENPSESNEYFNANPFFHSGDDTLEKVNLSLVARVARTALAAAAALAAPRLPDFAIESLVVSPPQPLPGSEANISLTVGNRGAPACATAAASVYIDGAWAGSVPVVLPSAGTANATFRWSPLPGTHDIEAVLDPDDRWAESDEGNNRYSITVTVPRGPDLAVVSISVSPARPNEGAEAVVEVAMANRGDAAATGRVALATVAGENSTSVSLAPNATTAVRFNWSAFPGTTLLLATVRDVVPFDTNGSNDSASVSVAVNRRPAATVDVTEPRLPTLQNATARIGAIDPDGAEDIAAYLYDFGDGSGIVRSAMPDTNHTYRRAGHYAVRGKAVDRGGLESPWAEAAVEVLNRPPAASIRSSPERPLTLEPVRFTANATDADGNITSLLWRLHDGTVSTSGEVTRNFMRPGNYTERLTAVDDDGGEGGATLVVTVLNRPPASNFTVAREGSTVILNGSASADPDGSIVLFRWEFGDGETSDGAWAVVAHNYSRPGRYVVNLTVFDDLGSAGNATGTVVVPEWRKPAAAGGGGLWWPILAELVLVTLLAPLAFRRLKR